MASVPLGAVAGTPSVEEQLRFRERFSRRLDSVISSVRAAGTLEAIQRDLAGEIAAVFGAKRLTLYLVTRGRGEEQCLLSKVAIGLASATAIRLPVDSQSVAGYVSKEKCVVNIANVYDRDELNRIDPQLRFNTEVDSRTGFVTRQTLCAPILAADRRQLLGVMQLLNRDEDGKFPDLYENGVRMLTFALGQVLSARQQSADEVFAKYQGLIRSGLLTEDEFTSASKVVRDNGLSMEDVLERDFRIPVSEIGKVLAANYGVDYEPFRNNRVRPGPDLMGRLQREFVLRAKWLPIGYEKNGSAVRVMCVDPDRSETVSVCSQVFPRIKVVYLVTTLREFAATVDQFFPAVNSASLDDAFEVPRVVSVSNDMASMGDETVVVTINRIITEAHRIGASDIHFEPSRNDVDVRVRRDGIMHRLTRIPREHRLSVTSRLKVMASLDISERRLPQDGKIRFKQYAPLDIEMRVSTMPMVGDVEDVVLRLSSVEGLRDLNDLGIAPDILAKIKAESEKPYGLLLVTGPTGSGKTTTLHSILKPLNTPERKIMTVEDPVEIEQPGLRQVSVNTKAGLTFDKVMRSFLRHDPDIIMVGECRDVVTAATAVEASLTCHLVLSTLHTNSPPEAAVRLLELGLDPYNFSYALRAVLGQRLARRLCKKCRTVHVVAEEEIKHLVDEYCAPLSVTEAYRLDPGATHQRVREEWQRRYSVGGRLQMYRPTGCQDCFLTGYQGRIGVHELMLASQAVKDLIQARAPVSAIYAAALSEGMRTLKQDGIEKMWSGLTDMAEVRRIAIA